MRIVSGGQTGVDRAALDVAIALGLDWGGWCPKGGWAEDMAQPPGLLTHYPRLVETPLANPVQRTEWNVRDSDATLILVDGRGLATSVGTQRAYEWARTHGKPELVVDAFEGGSAATAATWLAAQTRRFGADVALGIGGPRESEVPGIYAATTALLLSLLRPGRF